MDENFVTPMGLKCLQEKEKLIEKELENSQQNLGEMARGDPGDGIDDSLFIQANMTVSMHLESLRQIRSVLAKVRVISKPQQAELVSIGHEVTINLEYSFGDREEIQMVILGTVETNAIPKDLFGDKEIVSDKSPLGLAAIGKKVGEEFYYMAGGGKVTGTVLKISVLNEVFL